MIDNQTVSDEIGVIRRGWLETASAMAPGVEGLSALLSTGLDSLSERDLIDESHLLGLVDQAVTLAEQEDAHALAPQLAQRLRRTVYEYLLALDATIDKAPAVAAAPTAARYSPPPREEPPVVPITDRGTFLIGAEEVAALQRERAEESSADAEAAGLDVAVGVGGIVPDGETAAGVPERTERAQGKRFGLFRRQGRDEPGGETDATEILAAAEAVASEPASAAEPPAAAEGAGERFPIMPRHGFHLGDPNRVDDDGETAAPARSEPGLATPATGIALEAEESAPVGPDLRDARRKIDEKLKKKKCDEAAALLQQLAQEVGGREVAELAVDAGDRCRELGKRQSATNCYLAASRSDPVFETSWQRLADVCIDDRDIDLAVSYLERVARLARLRGDHQGSLRVYRKIVTIAPQREDILEILMRAQAAGTES